MGLTLGDSSCQLRRNVIFQGQKQRMLLLLLHIESE